MEKKVKNQLPVCPVAKKCGGCQYQGKTYEFQLKEKENQVKKLMKPFCQMKPILGMKEPYYYRNKVHAVFGRNRKGEVIKGIYEANSHKIIDIDWIQA